MTILNATKNDINEIQNLQQKLNIFRDKIFSKENKPFHKKTKKNDLLSDKNLGKNIVLVATLDKNKIVGYIIGSIHQRINHKLNKLGCVDELFIKKEYRKQGIAHRLLIALKKQFKQKGCDHMAVQTDAENNLSQKFYTSEGMHNTTVEFWKKL